MKKQLTTYPLRLPASLKAAVAEISKADGTSINQFVATAVAEKVSALRTAEFFAGRVARADPEEARRLLRRAGGPAPGSRRLARGAGNTPCREVDRKMPQKTATDWERHGDGSGARGGRDRPR